MARISATVDVTLSYLREDIFFGNFSFIRDLYSCSYLLGKSITLSVWFRYGHGMGFLRLAEFPYLRNFGTTLQAFANKLVLFFDQSSRSTQNFHTAHKICWGLQTCNSNLWWKPDIKIVDLNKCILSINIVWIANKWDSKFCSSVRLTEIIYQKSLNLKKEHRRLTVFSIGE